MGLRERPRCRSQECVLLISDPPGSKAMQIDTGMHREELLHEAMFVHVQAKDSHPLLARCRHMQYHAQGEAHLARRRWGRDDDQIRTLPSSDEGVEILHTRGNASHLAPLWGSQHFYPPKSPLRIE